MLPQDSLRQLHLRHRQAPQERAPSCEMARAFSSQSVATFANVAAALRRRLSPCAAYMGPSSFTSRSNASPATSLTLSLQSLRHRNILNTLAQQAQNQCGNGAS